MATKNVDPDFASARASLAANTRFGNADEIRRARQNMTTAQFNALMRRAAELAEDIEPLTQEQIDKLRAIFARARARRAGGEPTG